MLQPAMRLTNATWTSTTQPTLMRVDHQPGSRHAELVGNDHPLTVEEAMDALRQAAHVQY